LESFGGIVPLHWTLGSIQDYNQAANRAARQLHFEWRNHAGTISVRKFDGKEAEERAERLAIPLVGRRKANVSVDWNG
jgi:Ribonuclease G/E